MKSGSISIRAVVFLGFGLIIGLWTFAWFEVSLRLREAQAQATAVNARYVAAQDSLANIRAQVLTGSVLVRDALLSADATRVDQYRSQLASLFTDTDAMLATYVPVSDSIRSRTEFDHLREEYGSYRATILDVLATDSGNWRADAGRLLRSRLTPKRGIVLAISDDVQSLNRMAYIQQQEETGTVYRSLQRELWLLLGLAISIGIIVAAAAVVYAGRLERQIRKQMLTDLELTQDLQRLSEKLVTAQEQERRKIARELHDEIGQALTAIKVELAFAQNSIDTTGGSAGLLHDARTITDGALQQVRDLSYLLHPAALDELGLPAAVESYVKRYTKRTGIDVKVLSRGMDRRLAPEIEASCYRIIQEALTNVARHSGATVCRVELAQSNGSATLTISDNGVGFDSERLRTRERHGLGLIGIRERAFHMRGTVMVDSQTGQGTRLAVHLPVRFREDTDEEPTPLPDPTAA